MKWARLIHQFVIYPNSPKPVLFTTTYLTSILVSFPSELIDFRTPNREIVTVKRIRISLTTIWCFSELKVEMAHTLFRGTRVLKIPEFIRRIGGARWIYDLFIIWGTWSVFEQLQLCDNCLSWIRMFFSWVIHPLIRHLEYPVWKCWIRLLRTSLWFESIQLDVKVDKKIGRWNRY